MTRRVLGVAIVCTAVLVSVVAGRIGEVGPPIQVLHDAAQGSIQPRTLNEHSVVRGAVPDP